MEKEIANKKFKEMRSVEMTLFHLERPKHATTLLVTIHFAKAPKFVRGSSPIAAHCKCFILLLEQ